MKKKIKKLNKKLKKMFDFGDPRYIYILAGMVFFTGVMLIGWFIFQGVFRGVSDDDFDNYIEEEEISEESEECEYRRKLDGVCVYSKKQIDPDLVGVIIENNRDAWPLSGVSEASIVYEAQVEGGITRYLAIYTADTEVEEVGPVRSARPYYIDWLGEYGSIMFMHVGGSPEALNLIERFDVFDINEFYRSWYFWRGNGRNAPHNTYTSEKLWNKAYEGYREYIEKEDYNAWFFEKIESCKEDCVKDITVPASWTPYQVKWKYDESSEQYVRYQGRNQAYDASGKEILADNVVVQMVKQKTIDEIGRQEINTIGEGEVYVFRNGKLTRGTWEKTGYKDRTMWYDNSGDIITLKPGKIWIEVLSDVEEVEWE
jgi:hypothetical protein